MADLITETHKVILDIPVKYGRDDDEGDGRRYKQPGVKKYVIPLFDHSVEGNGRDKQDGRIFAQAGEAQKQPEKDEVHDVRRAFEPPDRKDERKNDGQKQ